MAIHKEGYKILIFGLFILILLNIIAGILLNDKVLIKWIFGIGSLMMYIFLLFFFRLPIRQLEPDPGLVYSPADGKVVVIEETEEKEYFKDLRLQVSIFMSPFNMHSNRYPVSGRIKYVGYHPGHYLVAWHPKSSTENERHSVVYRKNGKEILIKQIAGAVAKRIVNYLQAGQQVKQSDEMGFIKFGSRVDILLPLDAKINVKIGDKPQGGVTVIAEW